MNNKLLIEIIKDIQDFDRDIKRQIKNNHKQVIKKLHTMNKSLNSLNLKKEEGEYYNQADAAKAIHTNATTFRRNIKNGNYPLPTYVVGARKYYNENDIEMLKNIYKNIQADEKTQSEKRRDNGFYSKIDMANAIGVNVITINHHIKRGHIMPPIHRYDGYKLTTGFYNEQEKDDVINYFKEKKIQRNGRPYIFKEL